MNNFTSLDMFWIDKQNRKKRGRGHRIVNDFLRNAWNEQNKKYVNCDYSSFKRNGKMERLLHLEQDGFCCYCMRHMRVGEHTSIEHVMPHHCKKKNGEVDYRTINYYKRFNKNFKNVAYIHLNGSTHRWHTGPKYPHFCAYENLVLSCDGSLFVDEDNEKNIYPSKLHLCCNERRGNKQIVPLFFLSNVKELIVYKEDGRIEISNKVKSILRQIELSNTIDELVLDHERLIIIRQVWCLIAKSHLYGIDEVKIAISDDTLRRNILADCGVPARIEKRVRQPIYWSLLYDYYWFYRYFSNS